VMTMRDPVTDKVQGTVNPRHHSGAISDARL
jgi:hypothetical protein